MSLPRSKVLGLYRQLLRLHQKLPGDFGTLGTKFVQQEFRGHRDASAEHAKLFIKEWTKFAATLQAQVNASNKDKLGQGLSKTDLDLLNEQQLVQLYELFNETRKPVNPETR